MNTKPASTHDVLPWRLLLPCIAAGIAALLLSSAGCGSTANSADTAPKSAVGKVAKQALAGKPFYTATAYLRVRPKTSTPAEKQPAETEDFAMYVKAQAALVTSRPVIEAALKAPEVVKLGLGERTPDPAAWLAERLRTKVSQTRRKEDLIEVSVTSGDPAEAATLANAVISAYLTDLGAEVRQKRARCDQLGREQDELTKKMRSCRGQLKDLVEKLGTTDPKALALKQNVAAHRLVFCEEQIAQVELEVRKAKAEIDVCRATLAAIAKDGIPESEVDKAARTDQKIASELYPKLQDVERSLMKVKNDAKKVAELEKRRRDVQSQIAVRREELREKLKQDLPAALELSIQKSQRIVSSLQARRQELGRESEQRGVQLEQIKKSTAELALGRKEIEQLERPLKGVADELELLVRQINAPPQVTLGQRADVPTKPD